MAASGDDRGIEPREAAARPSALGEQLIETNRRFVEIRQPEIGESATVMEFDSLFGETTRHTDNLNRSREERALNYASA
jgi:hypothetical protein